MTDRGGLLDCLRHSIIVCVGLLASAQALAQAPVTWDPSGVWSNNNGSIALLLAGDALSFSYQSVFGQAAHICDVAGVAGLEHDSIYHFVEDGSTIAIIVTEKSVRLQPVSGVPSFCGANWSGDEFPATRRKRPQRAVVTASRSRFFVVMSSPPMQRKGYVVRGDVLEIVPVQHSEASQYVLARFRSRNGWIAGMLLSQTLERHK